MKYTPKFQNPNSGGIKQKYVIKKGDTLSAIAKAHGTTVKALLAANPEIKDANKIAAGATLNLGKPAGNPVEKVTTFNGKSVASFPDREGFRTVVVNGVPTEYPIEYLEPKAKSTKPSTQTKTTKPATAKKTSTTAKVPEFITVGALDTPSPMTNAWMRARGYETGTQKVEESKSKVKTPEEMVEDLRYRMFSGDTRFRSTRPAIFGGGQFSGAGASAEFGGPNPVKAEWTELNTPIPGETFNEAYAKARKAKLKEFTFNGKKYTTDVAPEGDLSWKGKGNVTANMRLNLLLDENNEVLDEYTRVEPEMAQPLVRVFNKPTKRVINKKQQGGSISSISEEQKQELFPYFAYMYSKELNPEKYGNITNMDEWVSTIQESEEDINIIAKAASELTDEDWTVINQQYMESQQEQNKSQAQFAAKGAKLRKLKESAIVVKAKSDGGKFGGSGATGDFKPTEKKTFGGGKFGGRGAGTKYAKGGKTCSCGCKMVLSKEAGGKLKSTCACKCGGKMKKKGKK